MLTDLAVRLRVSAATQNHARSVLPFLCKAVLGVELPWLGNVEPARRLWRLPVAPTVAEAETMPGRGEGTAGLMLRTLIEEEHGSWSI